jgi:hypothetical protein
MKQKILFMLLIAALFALETFAVSPRAGWVKVEITSAEGAPKPIPQGLVVAFGGEDGADYGSFRIASVPEHAIAGLEKSLARAGFRLRRRDELDRIDTPRASIDARTGLDPAIPATQLIRAYPAKKNGLYLVQLIGPSQAEWMLRLGALGWKIARYIPNDAYVLIGPAELVAQTRKLAFVQFFDFYHPFEKHALLPAGDEARDLIFSLPAADGVQETIDAISAVAAAGSVQVDRYEHDVYVRARLARADALALLHDPLVIGVESAPVMRVSDERQAMSLTSNVNTAGSQPTSPTGYLTWLLGRCSACSSTNMPASTWRVGMADTGLDGGTFGTHHADLSGREFWGGMFVSTNDNCANGRNDCDVITHGTLVAGIMAGNASLAATDSLGYYDGAGVAPSVGVYSTKIFAYPNVQPTDNIFTWATDAATGNATIQNHSWNAYGNSAGYGLYTALSRDFDLAARDVDNNSANGRTPMLFTVAAGNRDQGTPGTVVIPPATAKNIISMGGLENYRPDRNGNACHGVLADDFRNLMSNGRHGTSITGYYKPDLVAPASLIVSVKSQWNPNSNFYCDSNFDGSQNYQMESGTSFAAPVAAGAALLVKRYLGSTPSSVTPALAKAALIAGARSVKGGLDRVASPATTIGAIPNMQQGFGRISLDSVLTGSTPPVFFDEATNREFSTTGQTWTTRLAVRDSSKPVVLALVWTDAAGAEGATNPLVNNLNLTVRPVAANCTYFQGNSIGTTDEQSISYACTATAPVDSVNNVEVARFTVSGYTQFDVNVAVGNYGDGSGTTQPFALVAVNADLAAGTSGVAPQLTATADTTTPTNVHLIWTGALNIVVTRYDVSRGSTLGNIAVVSSLQTSPGVLAQDDNGRPSGINTWLYKVTAVPPSGSSLHSNVDMATTVAFNATDDTLNAIRAVHFTKLLEAVNAIRTAAGLSAVSFAAPAPAANLLTAVLRNHLMTLRNGLDAARSTLSLSPITYTNPTITDYLSKIKDVDIVDLRNGVK